jgi:AraC-like DNA-binding protein
LLQDLGARFAGFNQALLEAVGWHPTAPRRAEARVWDLLWQLTGDAGAAIPGRHPAVERARHYIERHLSGRLTVAAIARYAGCSHTHLVRLFRAELGTTIVAHVRRRRAERAAYLLRHSPMPIKQIPAQIGLSDLHAFNKTVRRELGRSPREVRRG